MKKRVYILFGIICFFALTCSCFAADEIHIIDVNNGGGTDCSGLFTGDALDLISEILNWIRIIGPILMILLTAVDFAKVIISDDPNAASKKIVARFVKRGVAVALLLLIPTIVRLVLNLPGVRDSIQIPNDPLCGTMSSKTIIERIY